MTKLSGLLILPPNTKLLDFKIKKSAFHFMIKYVRTISENSYLKIYIKNIFVTFNQELKGWPLSHLWRKQFRTDRGAVN